MRKILSIILISLIIILNILPPINSYATEPQQTQQEETEDKTDTSESSGNKYTFENAGKVESVGLPNYKGMIEKRRGNARAVKQKQLKKMQV